MNGKLTQTKEPKEKDMSARVDFKTQTPDLLKRDAEFNNLAIEQKVRDLVAIRASPLNACAFCLNRLCLRNTSALLPDRFSCKSFRTISMNEDSPN